MSGNFLPVVLTFDIGPALATFGTGHEIDVDWEPTFEAVPTVLDALGFVEDTLGADVPCTFFVRADALVAARFGDAMHVLRRFRERAGRRADKHELAWMPQLLHAGRVDLAGLGATFESFRREYPALQCARGGDCFHDNASMEAFDMLGLRFDSTAAPGRTKFDPGWAVDWRNTPDDPYRPSIADYRLPGTPCRRIIETPLSMLSMKAPYDPVPLRRYVNPCFHEHYLWPSLERSLADSRAMICVSHPDEFLPVLREHGHPMVSYDAAVFASSVIRIARTAREAGRQPVFVRMRDYGDLLDR